MKRSIFFTILTILIGMSGVLIYSCNKSSADAICKNCKPINPLYKQIQIRANGQIVDDMQMPYYKGKNPYNNEEQFERGQLILSDPMFNNVSQELLQISQLDIKTYAIVLYFNRLLSDINQINTEEISAFSLFYSDKEGLPLHHRLFIAKDNNFIENLEFNFSVGNITVNQLTLQLNVIIPKIQDKSTLDKSYVVLFNKTQTPIKSKNLGNDFLRLYKKYNRPMSLLKDSNPTEDCALGCYGSGNFCVEIQGFPQPCETYNWDPCASSDQIQTLINGELMDEDSVYLAYDSVLFYTMKDSILSPNRFGRKYIDYYYTLSSELRKKSIPTSLIISTARTAISCRRMFQLLENPITNADSVLMSSTQKNELLDLIDNYKLLFTDAVSIGKLNEIKNDVTTYYNFTIHDFLTTINN
jgi:hypothetical protein